MDHQELLVELRKDNEYLRKRVDVIERDVREVHDALIKYKGWFGGALFVASCVGAAIAAAIQYIAR